MTADVRPPTGILPGAGAKLAGDGAGRLLQFAVIYYAQLSLGPVAYGSLVYGAAIGLVCAQVADPGIQLTVTRAMVADRRHAGALARAGLRVKACLAVGVAIALAFIVMTRPAGTRVAVWVAAITVVVGTFIEYAGYAFRGLHRVADDSRLNLSLRVMTAAAGGLALWLGAGVMGFAVAQALAAVLVASAGWIWLTSQLPPDPPDHPRVSGIALLSAAWPLGAAIVLSVLSSRTPTFVLDALWGTAAVGAFGVAQRLVEPFSLLPAAALAAVFPALVRETHREGGSARALKRRTTAGLAVLGAMVGLCVYLAGPWVVQVIYGELYAEAGVPLQVLAVGAVLTFTNYALTHFLVADERQHVLMFVNAAVLLACVALCAALVPTFGLVGAASSVVVAEGILLAACIIALRLAPPAAPDMPVAPLAKVRS